MKQSLRIKLLLVKYIKNLKIRKLLSLADLKQFSLNILLIISLLLGIFYRIYNLNWDAGLNFHPDEGNLGRAVIDFNPPQDINPDFFAYNGFLIFLAKFLGKIFSIITKNDLWESELGYVNLTLRIISSAASVISLLLFYLISKKIFKKNWAIISLSLFSTTVGLIQAAHFGVSESFLVFEILLISYLTMILYEKNKDHYYWIITGLTCGITIATKTTGALFLLIPAIGTLILIIEKKNISYSFRYLYLLITAIVVFLLTSPMSIIYKNEFLSSMDYEKGVVDGTYKVFYTIQFRHAMDYYFFYKDLHWFTGILIPVLFLFGIPIWIYNLIKRKTYILSLNILIVGITCFINITII